MSELVSGRPKPPVEPESDLDRLQKLIYDQKFQTENIDSTLAVIAALVPEGGN